MSNPITVVLESDDPGDRPSPPEGCKWSQLTGPSDEHPFGIITFHFEDLPPEPTEEFTSPNWAQFRLGMLSDPGFRRVVSYGEPIDQASLASEINKNEPDAPSILALQLLWGSIVSLVPGSMAPTSVEVAVWNAIATDADIPFRFSPNGYLEV